MLRGCCRAETHSQQRDEGNVWESSHGGAGECHSLHSHESFQLAMNERSMNEERAAEATLLALAPYLVGRPRRGVVGDCLCRVGFEATDLHPLPVAHPHQS